MSPGKVILVVLATLVIFSTGLITGGVLVKQLTPTPSPAKAPEIAEGPRWQPFLHRVQAELDLSLEQHERVAAILRDSQERARSNAGAEFRKVRDQIQAELTPAQKQRFEQLLKERQRRMKEVALREGRAPGFPNGPMTSNGWRRPFTNSAPADPSN